MNTFEFVLASENALKLTASKLSSDISNADSPAFYAAIRQQFLAQNWPWMIDALAAESSVTIFFDIESTSYREVESALKACLGEGIEKAALDKGQLLTLPVSYGGEIGEDLDFVAAECGLSVAEVVGLHQTCVFTVTAVGFAPGFGYLKGLPKSLRLSRRATPRIQVPKGAVAIAEDYTAIYPESSPGGWHIIGYCPEQLFDVSLPRPALFEVGQKVKFIAID